jgi:hypothetical protein
MWISKFFTVKRIMQCFLNFSFFQQSLYGSTGSEVPYLRLVFLFFKINLQIYKNVSST